MRSYTLAPSHNVQFLTPFFTTGFTAVPDCADFRFDLTPPYPVVMNSGNTYLIQLIANTTNPDTLRFAAVKIRYRLQVSPAPASPTFTDVPATHPFYQFIEALAASGITAGCSASPPQYCPDAMLTRGQMAVFLARALGLHWVP